MTNKIQLLFAILQGKLGLRVNSEESQFAGQ